MNGAHVKMVGGGDASNGMPRSRENKQTTDRHTNESRGYRVFEKRHRTAYSTTPLIGGSKIRKTYP